MVEFHQMSKPDIRFEITACVVCGAAKATPLFNREDLVMEQPGRFQVVQCDHCGHQYLNPRPTPESISFYYPQSYSPYNNPHPEDMRSPWGYWLVTHPLNQRCRLVHRYQPGGNILDLGCSTGQFLGRIARFGVWERFGVETNPSAAVIARSRYQIPVVAGLLQATHFDPARFDVVTLWDVIEHVHDPEQTLREINRILKPGAYLFLSTPVLDSLEARLFRQNWVGYELPRHLNFFSRRTLTQLLKRTGFYLEETRIVFGSNYALTDSLFFWARSQRLPGRGQFYLKKMMQSLPWHLFTAPIFKVLDLLALTTPVTFICQKLDLARDV